MWQRLAFLTLFLTATITFAEDKDVQTDDKPNIIGIAYFIQLLNQPPAPSPREDFEVETLSDDGFNNELPTKDFTHKNSRTGLLLIRPLLIAEGGREHVDRQRIVKERMRRALRFSAGRGGGFSRGGGGGYGLRSGSGGFRPSSNSGGYRPSGGGGGYKPRGGGGFSEGHGGSGGGFRSQASSQASSGVRGFGKTYSTLSVNEEKDHSRRKNVKTL